MEYKKAVQVTVFKEKSRDLIVSFVVASKAEANLLIGDIIERDGYETLVEEIED